MLLQALAGPTYTACVRRVSLMLSLSSQKSNSLQESTQPLRRARSEVTTIQFFLDFYAPSSTLLTLTPIQLCEFIVIPFYLFNKFSTCRFQTNLLNSKVRVVAGDFPALLYPYDGFDPDDLESGLFRNPILLRVRKINVRSFTKLI